MRFLSPIFSQRVPLRIESTRANNVLAREYLRDNVSESQRYTESETRF